MKQEEIKLGLEWADDCPYEFDPEELDRLRVSLTLLAGEIVDRFLETKTIIAAVSKDTNGVLHKHPYTMSGAEALERLGWVKQ